MVGCFDEVVCLIFFYSFMIVLAGIIKIADQAIDLLENLRGPGIEIVKLIFCNVLFVESNIQLRLRLSA